MTSVEDIKSLLSADRTAEAVAAADELLACDGVSTGDRAVAYYLRGNACRKQGNWRMAMNSYLEAKELDPDGPAAMAYDHVLEILEFFNKDLYNP